MNRIVLQEVGQCLGKRGLQLHLGPPSPPVTSPPATADTAGTTTTNATTTTPNKRPCTMTTRAELAARKVNVDGVSDVDTTTAAVPAASGICGASQSIPEVMELLRPSSAFVEPPDYTGNSADQGRWDVASWDTNILASSFPLLEQGRNVIDRGCSGKTVDEACKRTLDHFPNPSVAFPTPSLEFDFRVAVTLKPEASQVQGRAHKEIIAISSGSWSGSFGHGKVLAGGYDLGQARGFRPIRIVEGAFIMQTNDEPPARLEMRTRGSLSGPCDILDDLLSPRNSKQIDPRKYGFRMFLTIKTADKRYAEIVNCGLWVASGVWKDDELLIDSYRVA